jgi:hypothetical protein
MREHLDYAMGNKSEIGDSGLGPTAVRWRSTGPPIIRSVQACPRARPSTRPVTAGARWRGLHVTWAGSSSHWHARALALPTRSPPVGP